MAATWATIARTPASASPASIELIASAAIDPRRLPSSGRNCDHIDDRRGACIGPDGPTVNRPLLLMVAVLGVDFMSRKGSSMAMCESIALPTGCVRPRITGVVRTSPDNCVHPLAHSYKQHTSPPSNTVNITLSPRYLSFLVIAGPKLVGSINPTPSRHNRDVPRRLPVLASG